LRWDTNSADYIMISAWIAFSRKFRYDRRHCRRVALLSRQLFDQLKPLHGLSADDRGLLYCAALLHDIGWHYGAKDHHKKAMRLIINSPALKSSRAEKIKIGLIARYHRGSLPRLAHPYYPGLSRSDRRAICWLGAMLRLADGLDNRRIKKDLLEKVSKRKILSLKPLRLK